MSTLHEDTTQNQLGHLGALTHFVECIKEDKDPLTNAVEETETLKVILAAYESIRRGAPVKVAEIR